MSSDWLSLRSELFNFLTYALPVISTSGCQSTEQSRSGLDWLADDKIKELGQKDKRGEHKIKLINDLFASSYPHSPFPVSHFCRVARGWWSVALIPFSCWRGRLACLCPPAHSLCIAVERPQRLYVAMYQVIVLVKHK